MSFALQTARLTLRELAPDDAPFLYALNADPEVLRWTGDPPFADVDDARAFLRGYDAYARTGMGRWLVLRDDAPIGWCGLKDQRDTEGYVDLGYRFARASWGHGYATEAARACVTAAREVFGLDRLVARVALENTRSIAVIERLGFTFWKDAPCGPFPGRWYARAL